MLLPDKTLRDIELKIILSLKREMILDDLLEERDVYSFEKKRRWLDQWENAMAERTGYGREDLYLSFQGLKELVVNHMIIHEDEKYKEKVLEQCCRFRPYYPMPGWDDRELRNVKVNTGARELTLEKVCILLGLEENGCRHVKEDVI